MSNKKPLVRKALKQAVKDLTPEILYLKKNLNIQRRFDENWVVGVSYLDTKEQRKLNSLLGLDTNEGIAQWYAKS